MIKEFDSFRTDDEGTFYYYKDKNGVENEWSYNLDELEYYIKSNEEEIKRLTKRLEEAQLGFLGLDKENERLHSIIKEVREYIEKDTRWFDSEYAKIYGELCTCAGANDTRLEVLVNPSNLLEILDKENNND